MNLIWYINRLKKMSVAEIIKRCDEHLYTYATAVRYQNPEEWPYARFADKDSHVMLYDLPNWFDRAIDDQYQIYNHVFDVKKPLNWLFSEKSVSGWPLCHYSRIDYRPGNIHGDVRINWELNRLQFLPGIAANNEETGKRILLDWMEKNPYLHGPAYIASMEVALRWFAIYWSICLFKRPIEPSFQRQIAGLAIASGKYIEHRLSTHSSSGNHLILEAVGLFWIGKALSYSSSGKRWILKSRAILWEQIVKQICPDGSNKEQSFWYLGFVLGALYLYSLLEDRKLIPIIVWDRIEKAIEFIKTMTLPDGAFPDYGDRDDGFAFRLNGSYDATLKQLISLGDCILHHQNRGENGRDGQVKPVLQPVANTLNCMQEELPYSDSPQLQIFKDGGMSLMQWGKGRLLFRHADLGLPNMYGHGHADALSLIFFWNNTPVFIDPGSGQYNGDQNIRNYFRSTIAHNTIEVGDKDQARMLGPFLWNGSYVTTLNGYGSSPELFAEASHDGYVSEFSTIHTRKIYWDSLDKINIRDSFDGPGGIPIRGAFHLGKCKNIETEKGVVNVTFETFILKMEFPSEFDIDIYYGSKNPFIGWRTTIYANWIPSHSVVFSKKLKKDDRFKIICHVIEMQE